MKNITFIILVYFLLYSCSFNKQKLFHAPRKISKTDYFDNVIEDYYSYMENPNDSIFIKWLKYKKIESSIFFDSLDSIQGVKELKKKINKKTKTFKPTEIQITNDDNFFYLKKEAFNDSPKLFFRKSFDESYEELLFDPKNYNKKANIKYIINYIKPSWNSKKVVISLSSYDKEISEMIILDVDSKKVYPQVIKNCWPSEFGGVKWLKDDSGFIYVHIPDIDKNSKNYLLNTSTKLYKIGTNPKDSDVLFSKQNNPEININSEDFCEIDLGYQNDRYMFSYTAGASPYINYYYSDKDNIKWKTLFTKNDSIKFFLPKNDSIIFVTAKNASNFKVCQAPINDTQKRKLLIPEDSTATISDIAITKKGLFFVKTINGVEARLFHLKSQNKVEEIKIPKPSGYINVFSKSRDYDDLYIEIEGWLNSPEKYFYNFSNKTFIKLDWDDSKSVNNNLKNIVVYELEVPSYDGTMVPLSLVHKKGIKKNSNNRLLITAYGSYGWSYSPYLSDYLRYWVNQGGVYAVAHVRGGGEKGNKWYMDGYKINKKNSWKDLIACTEYLIKNKYTVSSKIAAWSASAGGITIGKAITERPELFSAIFIRSGLLNPLRSETSTNGKNSVKEFGTFKDSLEFKALYKMDPYYSIKEKNNYPAVFLTVGMNDARLPVWQPAKFAARLQEASTSNKPVLLSVDFEGGHGFEASQDKKNKELTDIMTFLFWQTGHPDFQPKK